LTRFLQLEQPLRVSRKFENLGALVHIGLVSFLVPVDFTLASRLLGAPFRRHFVEEDVPIEPVHAHGIEPAL
jgi:hypothetical protein